MSMYDEEALKLFSHRPDIKAKHSHISAKPKRKRNEINVDAILAFLSSVILFITYVCIYFF